MYQKETCCFILMHKVCSSVLFTNKHLAIFASYGGRSASTWLGKVAIRIVQLQKGYQLLKYVSRHFSVSPIINLIDLIIVIPYGCRPRHRRRILVRVRTFECTTSCSAQQLRKTTDRNHGEKVLEIKNYSNKKALILRANTMRRNIQNLNIITTARLW